MDSTPLSVLLVDDDPDTCTMFRLIADFYHLQSVIIDNAEAAYEYLAEHTPDVIILDIRLPEIDGYVAHLQIRERGLSSKSAIIATTSYYTMDTPHEIANRGFNGYIPKPFDPTTFIASLQEAIEKRKQILEISDRQARQSP